MNRQQRRAAARQRRARRQSQAGIDAYFEARIVGDLSDVGHSLDCGCHTRHVVPMSSTCCPECGEESVLARSGMAFPTSAEPGSLTTVQVGCPCGAEYDLTVGVQ